MSEQDRFDWNEDMDFESEADVQLEADDFEDPLDGFTDYDDLSDYGDLPETEAAAEDHTESQDGTEPATAEGAVEGLAEKIPAKAAAGANRLKQKRRRGISAIGLGIMFTASILVAGVGIGGAILLAEGVHPASLWQPQNLLQIDQLLNFADHPLNILYMVTLGIVFLALLGSYKMSKAAVEANARTRDAENMLDALTALSLDKQEDWQSQLFKEFPPAEAFVIRTLGAWRLQKARQKRLMGVEGELHRLEKALLTNSRSDLTGRFDHPAVGRLADEMIRYFDARDNAVRKLEAYENKDRDDNTEFMDTLAECRGWNRSTMDQLGVQCASLDELAGQMEDLAQHVEKASAETGAIEGMTDIIEGIRQDIALQSTGGLATDQTASELNDLVDRGSKLAFKIAMEVARLGPRGERLLPMSQSLEDLTTGFRQLTDRVNDRDLGNAGMPPQKSIHKKLDTLAAMITRDDNAPWQDVVDEVQDFGPAAARISGHVNRLVDGCNDQEDRLVQLGVSYAKVTGADFDSHSIPRKDSSEASVAPLDFTGPGSRSGHGTSVPEAPPVEPFTTADTPIMPRNPKPSEHRFSSPIFPVPSSEAADRDAAPDTTALELGPTSPFSLTPESSESKASMEDMSLSMDGEKVYDLEDLGATSASESETDEREQAFDLSAFGAVPVTDVPVQEQQQDQGEDQVYELSDFDPVPMQEDGDAGTDEAEEVYDLSQFDASAVVPEMPEPQEEVYDLSQFDASPLDQETGKVEANPHIEDEVFDLMDFGAKPMS
jgi:hypothetical protein